MLESGFNASPTTEPDDGSGSFACLASLASVSAVVASHHESVSEFPRSDEREITYQLAN